MPIYIQEIIEEVRSQARKDEPADQLSLFDDFNGIEFEELVDFYRHEQNWANRMILGDSLLVMTSLAEKEGLKGQVQMIYIDSPYGIKFDSNWQVSTRKRAVTDGKADDLTRQPEQIKAFRDTWELGIHSYLAYLRDRFALAGELLTETGSIFVQISDENVHLVRCLLDEMFGAENFVAIIPFRKKTMPLGAKYLEQMHDFLLWYGKDKNLLKYHQLYYQQNVEGDFHWKWYELPDGTRCQMTRDQLTNHSLLPAEARIFRLVSMWPPTFDPNSVYAVGFRGKKWLPPTGNCYPTNSEGISRLVDAHRLEVEGNYLRYVLYLDDYNLSKIVAHWSDTIGARDQRYVVETSVEVVKRCILMTTDPGDLVLDPTCGGGTTAYVAEQWGRRWITIDTSRVALALARTRLMSARYFYYILADSVEGVRKEAETNGQVPSSSASNTLGDIKKGFVHKRVPHVRLKSFANNEEIDSIYARYQEQIEPVRAQLNQSLHQSWERWQIPREAEDGWPEEAKQLHEKWWQLRQERQKEINESIARNSDQEILYDQPYEDNRKIRVAGPFTVESLSPHRVISLDEELPASESEAQQQSTGQFETMIIENLRKAGVQNTVKNERLKFDRLEAYAGSHIQAEGEYTESGVSKRVAVCIGPEHGTVGPELIKDAAKEAVQGIGFDLLIVCGFAFDPHVPEETKRYGKLTILITRMNPDLSMGDDLLKKTGAGNLFMVFGEPDIDVEKQPDGKLVVEIKGVDVYDPTTGEIRSNSTDDIACWFIDTNYNEESFFVRHAYFCGADEPYDKLKRALRSEIDEEAWSQLYTTRSYPFPEPETGKIAVKMINHYGDEVLKVYVV